MHVYSLTKPHLVNCMVSGVCTRTAVYPHQVEHLRIPMNMHVHVQMSMRVFSMFIPSPQMPASLPTNLTPALLSLPDEECWGFGLQMDVPWSTLDKIQSQFHEERKAAVIRVYMIEHPHPTWEHVSDVLYQKGYLSVL